MAAVLLAVSVTFAQQPPGGRSAPAAVRYNQSGDRIVDYFDVHAADIRSVLRQLSACSGVDIIAGDAVKATVSVAVSNKSWREILAIICMVHNLTVVEERSFVYVLSSEEAAKRGLTRSMMPDGTSQLSGAPLLPEADAPLIREVVPLKFTTATEMLPVLTPFLTQRGKLTAVQHTNSLLVVDTDDNIKELRAIVKQVDIQTPQISISCKIIDVSTGVVQRMGVYWGTEGTANNGRFNGGAKQGGQLPTFGEEGSVAMGATHRLWGIIPEARLDAALEFLFEDNKGEVVAQPQITTLNNKEARVFMGQQISILKQDESGNTVTEMIDAGTELIVTPYVAGDGKIMLSLYPKKKSYEPGPDQSVIINEQSAETNVLVNNGETVVIAGLTSNEKRDTEAGIPILKSIPIIGNLFKRSNKTRDKRDLIIFVTPHIIHPGI
jgi:type IV pilus assembly protein PilQ